MDSARNTSRLIVTLAIALVLAGCDRAAAPAADTTQSRGSTVQPSSAQAGASTPLPVAPAGLTNGSTASQGNDLTNSTSASGRSNMYQPPSNNNPSPSPELATGGSASAAASQTVSSQTRGTSQPRK